MSKSCWVLQNDWQRMFRGWHNNDTIFCVLSACSVWNMMLTSLGRLVHLSLNDFRRQVLQLYRQGVRGKETLRTLPKATWLTSEGMNLSTGFCFQTWVLGLQDCAPPHHCTDHPSSRTWWKHKGKQKKRKSIFSNFLCHHPLSSHQKDPCQVQWEANRLTVENWLRSKLDLGTTGCKVRKDFAESLMC